MGTYKGDNIAEKDSNAINDFFQKGNKKKEFRIKLYIGENTKARNYDADCDNCYEQPSDYNLNYKQVNIHWENIGLSNYLKMGVYGLYAAGYSDFSISNSKLLIRGDNNIKIEIE